MKSALRFDSFLFAFLLYVSWVCMAAGGAASQENSQPTIHGKTAEHVARSRPTETVVIPGPMRSFLRMAGISQEISSDEVLPILARNVSLLGYQRGRETEYLVLLNRYVHVARELQQLTNANGEIHIAGCGDASRLIDVLGYKVQGSCGQKDAYLVTANPERAFLTIDSGFPLTSLEKSLQTNSAFSYAYPATRVPIFFKESEWVGIDPRKKTAGGLVDLLLESQPIDRLYWSLSRCDEETRSALVQSPGLRNLLPLAAVFELYGDGISVRSGKIAVPGGAERDWEDVVGASPRSAGDFVSRLLTKDRGWLAAYYDGLSHLNQAQQAHLSEGARLRHLYDAYRSTVPRTDAGVGIFRRNAELTILFTSLKWEPNGDPQILEGLEVWPQILAQKTRARGGGGWPRQSRRYDTPERFLEMLVASSNLGLETDPVQTFLMLEAMNEGKPSGQRFSDATELMVAERLSQFSHWFSIFAEFPALDDTSVARFVAAADRVNGISNAALRANALGAMQANIGLWQILARQGQIPPDRMNTSWQAAVQPFSGAGSSVQLFEASRNSLRAMLTASAGNANLTQDQIVDLLAGPPQTTEEGRRVHQQLAKRVHAVLDDQRLVSLDTLFGLYDGLTEMAHGAAIGNQLLPLAGDLREFEMPRAIFTGSEKIAWSPVVYTSRHAELQVRTDLTKIIRSPASPAQLESARGQLTPFLRDTLVGLNYAYYEPPGAEVLHNNPLFVRSHDFSSVSVLGIEQIWGTPGLVGVGATAGGGAFLMGSLADLPYALASTEQEFITPKNVQALIWRETVPGLLVASIMPRWWTVSRDELHSAALYQRAGEELLRDSATDPQLKAKVISILSDRMTPSALEKTESALRSKDSVPALRSRMLPADSFYLASEFRKRYPQEAAKSGPAGQELDEISQKSPSDCNPTRLSSDFGVPHPILFFSNSRSLVNGKPFPLFGGNASRLLAESWESNNLYWARLADEMGYSPVTLNILAPTLTRHMITNIFASNIDDWPALARAMEETGEEFRKGKIVLDIQNTTIAQQ
jgi:hypothetical protein